MLNLGAVQQLLEKERARLQSQLAQIGHAITALSGKHARRKRKMSAAGLGRIRAAQKARWAKWRKTRRMA